MSNTSLKNSDLSPAIGITGGIGSGKSLVCEVFRNLGIPVFEADAVAKNLYLTDLSLKEELVRTFGEAVYFSDGKVNRNYLASVIFTRPEALEQVNRLVHPRVREAFRNWHKIQTAPFVLHEAAILFESGLYRMMDATILVTAPGELRIRRVMKRDHISRELVLDRMKHQWDEAKKEILADYIICNDEEHPLLEQILDIDQKIKAHGKFC